jgi:hypothetical protein
MRFNVVIHPKEVSYVIEAEDAKIAEEKALREYVANGIAHVHVNELGD